MSGWKFWARQPVKSQASPDDEDQPGQACSSTQDVQRPTTERVFFSRYTVHLTAWPTKGGVLIKNADAVDLEHLGVSRLEPTRRSKPFDADAEDAWAVKLLQVGAKWYRDRSDWLDAQCQARELTEREVERLFFGWPSQGNGVWLLRYADGQMPVGFGCYGMCLNMEERCQVLEKFGAQYYENATDCFELTQPYIDQCHEQRANLEC